MSLELAIQENTDVVRQLIAVLQSGAVLPASGTITALPGATGDTAATSPAPAPAARGRKAKTDAADPIAPQTTSQADPFASLLGTVNDGKSVSVKLAAGDPEGTRYIHIAKNRTVAAIHPGQTFPSIEGTVEIDGDLYAKLKAEYTPSVAQAPAPAPTPAAASTQASTPAAQAASSQQPASSAATGGPAVMQKAQAVHKAQGNDGLKQVLDHFKVGKVSEIVANGALHADAIAFMDNLLNPKAEEPNLFG